MVSIENKTVRVLMPYVLANRTYSFTVARVHVFVFLDMPAGMHKTQIAFEITDAKDKSFILAKVT